VEERPLKASPASWATSSVELRGGASLEDLSNPYYELFFYGRNADLVRMAGLQLRANVRSLCFRKRQRRISAGLGTVLSIVDFLEAWK
jgi:hypothetical protein